MVSADFKGRKGRKKEREEKARKVGGKNNEWATPSAGRGKKEKMMTGANYNEAFQEEGGRVEDFSFLTEN